MTDRDEEAFELAGRAARARFADDGTRAVLGRILDDLTQRLKDGRISVDEAAPIVDHLGIFCAPSEQPSTLAALRSLLAPERFASRARAIAGAYARLAQR